MKGLAYSSVATLLLIQVLSLTPPVRSVPSSLAPGTGGPGTGALPLATLAGCTTVQPDREFFIPEAIPQKGISIESGSGRYGYQLKPKCPFWVVDYKLNKHSNTILSSDGTRLKLPTEFYGIPYDLPGTKAGNPSILVTEEDCKRWTLEYAIYTKWNHESNTEFKLVRQMKADSTGCLIPADNAKYRLDQSPSANVLVVRVVTRMKLRSSVQETAAYARIAPPA